MAANKTEFIVQDLMSKIYQHKFKSGKLPPQRDLAKIYLVSRFTIQNVLNKLRDIGIIYTIQGDGIYIKSKLSSNPLIFNSITEHSYKNIESKLIYLKKIKTTPELSKIFNIENNNIWVFQRVRIVKFQIVQLETTYLPFRLFPSLNKEAIEDSMQNYVLSQNYKISYYITKYEATLVDKETSKILNCKKGNPAMNIMSRGLLRDGTIFAYSDIIALDYSCTYIVPFNKDVYNSRRN